MLTINTKKEKNKKIIMSSIIILIIIIGIFLIKNNSQVREKEAVAPQATVTNKVAVQIQKPKILTETPGKTYHANIIAYQEGIVSSKTSGKVKEILFENGKNISKGDPLIILDDQDLKNQLKAAENQLTIANNQLAAARVDLEKLEINLAEAQEDYDKTKTLFTQGAITKSQMDDMKTSLKLAKSNLTAGKIAVDISKGDLKTAEIKISTLKDSLENTVIKAPISGVMDEKNVNLGEMVIAESGGILARVKDISSLYAVIKIEQQNMSRIETGKQVLIKLNQQDETVLKGTIKEISISADPSSRTFNCKVLVNNQKHLLHPGDFVKVEVPGTQQLKILAIPLTALAGDEGDYYIFVNEQGIARRRNVTIGQIIKNMVGISSGLSSEDDVICTNVNTLQDGDQIIVIPPNLEEDNKNEK
ncbi:MAG: efflux RND transporter periplasmic adaptor subunit [Firmicutes bacterium]|nr:efflux RND transporter periplasmic adaptor subunit [Bacillota bacterium]